MSDQKKNPMSALDDLLDGRTGRFCAVCDYMFSDNGPCKCGRMMDRVALQQRLAKLEEYLRISKARRSAGPAFNHENALDASRANKRLDELEKELATTGGTEG